jgi:hypothetical protein
MTILANALAMRLMMGTTCAPPATAKLPPSQKPFCTSTTIKAASDAGVMSDMLFSNVQRKPS